MSAPSLHAQALARIEEEVGYWTRSREELSLRSGVPLSEVALIKSSLSAWQTLKDVLELQNKDEFVAPVPLSYLAQGYNQALEDLADLIIKGVLCD